MHRRLLVLLALLSCVAPALRADTLPTPAARTAGLARHEGFVPWWWDAARGTLLLQVPTLDHDLLYAASLAGGAGTIEVSLDRGQLGELRLVRFTRVGPRVLLVQRQTTHRADAGGEAARSAVEHAFPNAVLASLPIVAAQRDTVLVELYRCADGNPIEFVRMETLVERTSLPADRLVAYDLLSGPALFPAVPLSAEEVHAATLPLPLPSARIDRPEGLIGDLLDTVLQEEQIELRQIRVKYPRDSFFSKGSRSSLIFPQQLEAAAAADELYPGRQCLTLSFTLPRGSYATILVKRLTGL